MPSLRKLTKRFFLLLNTGVALVFLLACCNRFLHPDTWWFISLLAFIFPVLLILEVGFVFFWLFVSPRWILLPLLTLVIGWWQVSAFFALHSGSSDFSKKDSSTLRVLTWNVHRWDDFESRPPGTVKHRVPMLDQVNSYNADLLCFQEFYEPMDSAQSIIRYIRENLHYPYYYFSRDYESHWGKFHFQTGNIIFSRYPILMTMRDKVTSDSTDHTESLIQTDIDFHGQRVRLATVHLQSVLFKGKDFRDVEIVRHGKDSILDASRSLAKKLRYALGLRGYQADQVRSHLDKSPYPSVVCGDFNDLPNSYTYARIRGDRLDAFRETGFGIGRTYIHISPTLRIDYILPSAEFQVLQCRKNVFPYSDHYSVLADLRLPHLK